MRFHDEGDAITYIFRSISRVGDARRGPDELTRDVTPTRQLLSAIGLPSAATPREYMVITGSKGKGSTAAISARLLRALGHTVGLVTSPHLVEYRERIRVGGRMIPEADFLRILDMLAPEIDRIEAGFSGLQYFSPQGIFLAIALVWFEEQGVTAMVLEVGRGGRFDDMAVVPNRLSLFTPIMLEHTAQLGPTLDRIAWHKSGIIKPRSYAYSVPQASEVLSILQAEADAQDAEFAWIPPTDMAQLVARTDDGMRVRLGRYGEFTLAMHGLYELENLTLAVQGVGNMHARLPGIPHQSPDYIAAIHAGCASVVWHGRMQRLEDAPAVWVDGATTPRAARAMLDSLAHERTPGRPVIAIIGTPIDRDYPGVYAAFAPHVDHMILTETAINPNIRFPAPDDALTAARAMHSQVVYAPNLATALDTARAAAGADGLILMALTLPLMGEAMLLYGLHFEVI
jgi:dihydrofolate synthase/folylpolyglutamate synthase